ncbi:GNAT family N-acetyltransferase [Anaerococcus sp. AGMB00486]|uniref:GNAT family N-acetyltransferase n=1 Tax=Anaerococcus faecalis TaxID=2742993 RepID=A0ABX2NAK7_9FIRM|nr:MULTISPECIES: GNAT family N-acetyltransferase [Anaerococcus]MDY3006937.1 GNAT family N-acetyltransferase [Anaerococcus porci]NVF11731.1 GNAT family N-acetyltransferase [Anaerococcus faecalis]
MENTKLIISRRLIIRKFEEDDLNKEMEFFKEPKFYYLSDKYKPKEFIEDINLAYENKSGINFWHIVKQGINESIGCIKAVKHEDGVRIYPIINKSLRNRGYGKEAFEAVMDYFFTLGGYKKVYAKLNKKNNAFKTIVESLTLKKYDEDEKYFYYQINNLDYMKFFAIFGEI